MQGKLSKDSRYRPNEVKQNLEMVSHWSAQKWTDVLAKGGGQKKRFQYCLKPDCPEKLLYFRAVQGHSGRVHSGNALVSPVLQDNVLLPMNFTNYVYHVGHGKELRSIVHNGLIPGGFSTKTGRHAVFLTVVNPMDDEQGLKETICDLSRGNHFKIQYTGAVYCPLKKEDCNFTKQGPIQSCSMTRCLQSSLRKRYA